ncbi:MAG: hypothetical protein ACYC4Q_01685 [Victivallaceae bacterium]
MNPLKLVTIALITVLCSLNAAAFMEAQLNLTEQKTGSSPETAVPSEGSVSTKPSAIAQNEAGGVTVKVDNVECLKGKVIVLDDNSDKLSAGVFFDREKVCKPASAGKVYIHLDWVSLKHETGNIGFVSMHNTKSQSIFALMFSHDKTGIAVLGDKKIDLKDITKAGVPLSVDIMLDLNSWKYEVKLDGKKSAEGDMAKTEDKLYAYTSIFTTSPAKASFAITNVAISPEPISIK